MLLSAIGITLAIVTPLCKINSISVVEFQRVHDVAVLTTLLLSVFPAMTGNSNVREDTVASLLHWQIELLANDLTMLPLRNHANIASLSVCLVLLIVEFKDLLDDWMPAFWDWHSVWKRIVIVDIWGWVRQVQLAK